MTLHIRDPASLLLAVVAAAAALGLPLLDVAPNRLAHGVPVGLATLPIPVVALVGVPLVVSLAATLQRRAWLVAGAATALGVGTVAAVAQAAALLADPARPAQRIALGGGFWMVLGSALLVAATLGRRGAISRRAFSALGALAVAATVLAGRAGAFADLSLAREFEGHRDLFWDALLRHVELVLGALGLALLVGVPLARLASRHDSVLRILSLLQTIPSIALFGLLIAPLSSLAAAMPTLGRLGIGGTGPAPAVVALVLYALLPLVRSFAAGFALVPQAALEAARGIGFGLGKRFWSVSVPLALPVLLTGVRVVTVQTIGLAAVAALIGAGGLGTFVFQGIGQYALDLVLLGALPIVVLALAADAGFAALVSAAGRPA